MAGTTRFTAVVVLALAVAGGLAGPGAAQPAPVSEVELGACAENVRPERLRCGTLELPLERADPSRGTIPVTFAVRAPTDRTAPPRGTIFAVEGGPGYGSIGSARYYVHMLGPLLRTRQLVLVDMRGTGHSRAIDCPLLQSGRGSDIRGVAQCAELLGRDYGSYRTSAAADDIDDVRRALGIESISLYGDSYGTFLAQSYAFRHGRRLAALVLDSAYPVRGESAVSQPLANRHPRALDRL